MATKASSGGPQGQHAPHAPPSRTWASCEEPSTYPQGQLDRKSAQMTLQSWAASRGCRQHFHPHLQRCKRPGMLRGRLLLGLSRASQSTPSLLLRSLSGQSFTTSLEQHDGQLPLSTTAAEVEPLPEAAWTPEHINSVTLIGTVLTQPTLYHTTANQTVTNLLLGLRPRFSRSQQQNQSVALEAWGYASLQVAQYVHPGMQVKVEGQLREGRWTDKRTGEERRQIKVVVDKIHVIPPSSSAQSHHAAAAAAAGTAPQGEAAWQPQQPAAAAAAASAVPKERKPPSLTPSARGAHYMFQEQGMTFFEIANARGQNISTVVDYVLKGPQLGGLPLDWQRAASELQLGPKDSPWLTGDEVWAAISTTCEEKFPGEEPTAHLMSISLKRVRQLLDEAESETAAKLGAQESLAGGMWVSYGQIKLVIMMKLSGVDWNAIILQPPAVLPTKEAEAPPF